MSEGLWPEMLPKAQVILADPPWKYTFGHGSRSRPRPQEHYPVMTQDDIASLPVGMIAADDCMLFLWATSPNLPAGIEIIGHWGFRYVSSAVWRKSGMGMGFYFRVDHELLLVGRRGDPPLPDPSVRPSSVIDARKGIHSRKPWQVYEIIERMYPAAVKLELFCRTPQPGWYSWGNEATPNLFNGPILPLELFKKRHSERKP